MLDHQAVAGSGGSTADVTVALPVYNAANHLEWAITSALEQTVRPCQVLVFDNCSTDGTIAVALHLLSPEAVRPAPANGGAAWNFTRAVRESEGHYFCWLAADDRLLPRHLEQCLAALEAHPSAAAVIPGIRFVGQDGLVLREQRFGELASADPATRLRAFVRQSRWVEVYALYRRTVLEASPMFTDDFGTDVLLTWWFLLRGPLASIDEPLLEYREYPDKSVAEMAIALNPGAKLVHWRKFRLWRRLWKETQVTGLEPATARAARRELRTALIHPTWMMHLAEDVLLLVEAKAPPMARLLRASMRLASAARRAVRRHRSTSGRPR